MTKYVTAPVCDDCWKAREGDRVAVRFREPPREVCHFCGKPTCSGIYQRALAREYPPDHPADGDLGSVPL